MPNIELTPEQLEVLEEALSEFVEQQRQIRLNYRGIRALVVATTSKIKTASSILNKIMEVK